MLSFSSCSIKKILIKWDLRDDAAVRTKVWIPIFFLNQQFNPPI